MRRGLAWICAVALASVLAGAANGCGEETSEGAEKPLTKAEYQTTIDVALGYGDQADDYYEDLRVGEPADTCKLKAVAFRDGVRNFMEVAEPVVPPPAVADIHAMFIDAARKFEDHVDEVAQDVLDGKLECGTRLYERMRYLPYGDELTRTIDELYRHGYEARRPSSAF